MPSKIIIKPKQIYLPFECQPHEMSVFEHFVGLALKGLSYIQCGQNYFNSFYANILFLYLLEKSEV